MTVRVGEGVFMVTESSSVVKGWVYHEPLV